MGDECDCCTCRIYVALQEMHKERIHPAELVDMCLSMIQEIYNDDFTLVVEVGDKTFKSPSLGQVLEEAKRIAEELEAEVAQGSRPARAKLH